MRCLTNNQIILRGSVCKTLDRGEACKACKACKASKTIRAIGMFHRIIRIIERFAYGRIRSTLLAAYSRGYTPTLSRVFPSVCFIRDPGGRLTRHRGRPYKTATILRSSNRPVITTITTRPLIRPFEWINDFILMPDGATLCRRATSCRLASITRICSTIVLSLFASRDSSCFHSTPVAHGEWTKGDRDSQNLVIHFKLSRGCMRMDDVGFVG